MEFDRTFTEDQPVSEVVVVARARAREGKQQEMEQALREAMAPTHEEAGCFRYALHRGIEDDRTFVMIERWRSKEELDQHLATAHIQKLFAALGSVVEAQPEILVLSPISDSMGEKGRI